MTEAARGVNGYTAGWSAEDTDRLKSLWEAGTSATLIADKLGRARNGVIGKVHRLDLPDRATKFVAVNPTAGHPTARWRGPGDPRPRPKRRKIASPEGWSKKRKPPSLPQERLAAVQIGETRIACIADLGPRQCRYPTGTPRTPDFFFCAESIPADAAGLRARYCRVHADICVRPAP